MTKRIPALVVSGFLGSGKTTLVRALLGHAQKEGLRVAVVSNEFGELGIDEALLGDGDEAFVELEGGCVCCKLSDELRDTLQMLWTRVQPDRVVVETSGVALPFETQLNFWREPVSTWVESDMAVVVVNAEQLDQKRDLDGTFEYQVSSADLLLLNKLDLVEESAVEGLLSQLAQMAPGTPVVCCTRGEVDPNLLFPPNPGETKGRDKAVVPHHHEAFEATEIQVEAGIEPSALLSRIQGMGALRAKGFVETSEGLRLVQGVGRRVELEAPTSSPSADLVGRVVVIHRSSSPGHTHG